MEATLRTQLEAFANGIILDSDGKQSACYNFYDWFCNDTSLENKAKALFKKVKTFLKHHPEINLDTHYVFFKNNCPMVGSLYDDFRICDIETGNVVFTVTPYRIIRGRNRWDAVVTVSELWGRSNGFKQPLKEGKTFLDLFK